MLTGPIPATEKALRRGGLTIDDIDVFEVNEAFAPVPLAWAKETGASLEKTNPNGGAIALGHPLGATGSLLMTKLLHELERTGGTVRPADHVRGRRPGKRHDHRARLRHRRQALAGPGERRGGVPRAPRPFAFSGGGDDRRDDDRDARDRFSTPHQATCLSIHFMEICNLSLR